MRVLVLVVVVALLVCTVHAQQQNVSLADASFAASFVDSASSAICVQPTGLLGAVNVSFGATTIVTLSRTNTTAVRATWSSSSRLDAVCSGGTTTLAARLCVVGATRVCLQCVVPTASQPRGPDAPLYAPYASCVATGAAWRGPIALSTNASVNSTRVVAQTTYAWRAAFLALDASTASDADEATAEAGVALLDPTADALVLTASAANASMAFEAPCGVTLAPIVLNATASAASFAFECSALVTLVAGASVRVSGANATLSCVSGGGTSLIAASGASLVVGAGCAARTVTLVGAGDVSLFATTTTTLTGNATTLSIGSGVSVNCSGVACGALSLGTSSTLAATTNTSISAAGNITLAASATLRAPCIDTAASLVLGNASRVLGVASLTIGDALDVGSATIAAATGTTLRIEANRSTAACVALVIAAAGSNVTIAGFANGALCLTEPLRAAGVSIASGAGAPRVVLALHGAPLAVLNGTNVTSVAQLVRRTASGALTTSIAPLDSFALAAVADPAVSPSNDVVLHAAPSDTVDDTIAAATTAAAAYGAPLSVCDVAEGVTYGCVADDNASDEENARALVECGGLRDGGCLPYAIHGGVPPASARCLHGAVRVARIDVDYDAPTTPIATLTLAVNDARGDALTMRTFFTTATSSTLGENATRAVLASPASAFALPLGANAARSAFWLGVTEGATGALAVTATMPLAQLVAAAATDTSSALTSSYVLVLARYVVRRDASGTALLEHIGDVALPFIAAKSSASTASFDALAPRLSVLAVQYARNTTGRVPASVTRATLNVTLGLATQSSTPGRVTSRIASLDAATATLVHTAYGNVLVTDATLAADCDADARAACPYALGDVVCCQRATLNMTLLLSTYGVSPDVVVDYATTLALVVSTQHAATGLAALDLDTNVALDSATTAGSTAYDAAPLQTVPPLVCRDDDDGGRLDCCVALPLDSNARLLHIDARAVSAAAFGGRVASAADASSAVPLYDSLDVAALQPADGAIYAYAAAITLANATRVCASILLDPVVASAANYSHAVRFWLGVPATATARLGAAQWTTTIAGCPRSATPCGAPSVYGASSLVAVYPPNAAESADASVVAAAVAVAGVLAVVGVVLVVVVVLRSNAVRNSQV